MARIKLNPMFVFRVITALTVLGTMIACQFTDRMKDISSQLLTFATGAITYVLMEVSPELKELKASAQNKLLPFVKGLIIYSIVVTICICEYIGTPVSPLFYGFLGVVGAFLYG